jgi:hypothetical protein
VLVSHSRHVWSNEHVASSEGTCGWKASRASRSLCPRSVCSSVPSLDHSRAVRSADAVATYTPASCVTVAFCAWGTEGKGGGGSASAERGAGDGRSGSERGSVGGVRVDAASMRRTQGCAPGGRRRR